MAGGLPTGGDPNYIDPHPFSLVGGGFSDLNTRTEVNVRPILEADVKSRQATKGNSDLVFSGLNAALGLPGAIIKGVLQTIVGVPLQIIGGGVNAIMGAFRGIPASSIHDGDSENLLFNPQFNVDLSGWTSTVSGSTPHFVQVSSEGKQSGGAAKVVAGGGVTKVLRSTRVPVAKENKVYVSGWFKKYNGVGSGNPIRINLRFLDMDGGLLGSQEVGSASGNGSSDWVEITGAAVEPTDIHASCKFVEIDLTVNSTMNGGTVWWDDIEVKKGGQISQSLIGGLVGVLNNINGLFQGLLDTLAGVGEGIGDFLGIGLRLNFLNPNGTFDASQLANIANIPTLVVESIQGLAGRLYDLTGLEQTINQIGDIVDDVIVTPVNHVVTSFDYWFRKITGQIRTAENNVTALQQVTITTQVTGYRNPTWVCRYPIADVTYPEILQSEMSVFGTTSTASAGTAHTHSSAGRTNLQSEPGVWGVSQHRSRGGVITISNSTKMDTIGMWLRNDNVGTINNIFLEVFKEQADLSWAKVFSSDITSLLTTTTSHVEVTVPGGLVVQAGERYMVRVRNSSSVASQISVAGIWQQAFNVESSWLTTVQADTEKNSYTQAEAGVAFADGSVIPWCMIAAKSLLATDLSWLDDFDRSTLGGLWNLKSNNGGQLAITNNRMWYGGGAAGWQHGVFIRSISSDRMRVDGRMYSIRDQAGGLTVCSDADMTNYVWLAVSTGQARIFTVINGVLVERASVGVSSADADYSIYYVPGTNTYTVLRNQAPIGLTWTDTGNVITHGVAKRFGGYRINSVYFFADHVRGAAVDQWNVRDYTP